MTPKQVESRLRGDLIISTIKTAPETNNIVDNTPQYPNDDTSRDNFMTSSSPLSGKPGCALVLALGFYMNPVH